MTRPLRIEAKLWLAILNTVITAILYLITRLPSLGFIDSGELVHSANALAIAHPTGYPLYILLSRVRIMFAEVVFGFNPIDTLIIQNAVLGALTVGLMTFIIAQLFDNKAKYWQVGVIISGLGLAINPMMWNTATDIEVYQLTYFLLALVMMLLVGSFRDINRKWLLLAYLIGLAAGNHALIIMIIPWILVEVWRVGWRKLNYRQLIGVFLIGFSIYLYLPIRSRLNPFMDWDNPQTWQGFRKHITADQYQIWIGNQGLSDYLAAFGKYLSAVAEWGLIFAVLALIGVIIAFRKHKAIAISSSLMFLATIIYASMYSIPDIEPYYVPAMLVMTLWIGIAIKWCLELKLKIARLIAIGLIILGFGYASYNNYKNCNQRNNYLAEDLGTNLFKSLEQDGLILTRLWDFYSVGLYYQEDLGLRRDLVMLDYELLRRSWYVRACMEKYPEVFKPIERQANEFLKAVKPFEDDVSYDGNIIEKKFQAFIKGILDQCQSRPVYTDLDEHELLKYYQRVPGLLAWRLHPRDELVQHQNLDLSNFEFRFVGDYLQKLDARPQYIMSRYGTMALERGNIAMQDSLWEKALEEYSFAEGFLLKDARPLEAQANALYLLGRNVDALNKLQQLHAIFPSHPNVLQKMKVIESTIKEHK